MPCGRRQISNGLFVISFNFFSIEIGLPKLVFRIMVAVLCCNFKVPNRPKDIFYFRFSETDLSSKIRGIGIFLSGGFFQIINCTVDVLVCNFSTV